MYWGKLNLTQGTGPKYEVDFGLRKDASLCSLTYKHLL